MIILIIILIISIIYVFIEYSGIRYHSYYPTIKFLYPNNEEEVINNMLNDYNVPNKPIAIYGKNTSDKSVEKKYDQLLKYGFKELYIYYGGLFEWLLLNEIYGYEEFPLNKNHSNIDILKYRNSKVIV